MRLHVVDGTFELFRAYFSKRPALTSPSGQDVKAAAGVVASMLTLLRDASEAVTHLAVAFDNPIRSFRNDLFDGYKTEDGVPPELLAQFDLVEEGVAAMGVMVWSMRDHEADDALATAAERFAGQVQQVRILTPDKDLNQCLRGREIVQVDRVRRREIDEATVLATRGIRPKSVPDFLALTGDTADGIPGLPGFGNVTAAALLGHYGDLESIPDDARQWAVKLRVRTRWPPPCARGVTMRCCTASWRRWCTTRPSPRTRPPARGDRRRFAGPLRGADRGQRFSAPACRRPNSTVVARSAPARSHA